MDALEHLAFATTPNRDLVTQLTTSIQELTAANKQLTNQLQQMLKTKENWCKNYKLIHSSATLQNQNKRQEGAIHLFTLNG
jgi:exonuclease VII large subunit